MHWFKKKEKVLENETWRWKNDVLNTKAVKLRKSAEKAYTKRWKIAGKIKREKKSKWKYDF